jgi:gas vesicle structural protein
VRAPADVIEVLDRVLDRGIVIDAWLRVSLVGLTLVDVDARVVVASIRTYVRDGDAVATRGIMARSGPSHTPAKRLPAARRRRARRTRPPRAKVMLRCAEGCTFLRASQKSPVRCPSDHSRRCAVSAVESGQAGLQ